ncbi:hypothetical protein [Lentzea sp. NBRC 102530]|uniref:hypothetical protein n=1 Tax=Lentzea sp. NBRC 102530 TaxID=3032201 RepID=UPI00249FCC9A|nr:hypothetical protein [Lentzea sp. NBRC 102530]GLY50453.1 hypothetical protein Lesp01_41090 [Lentzea sp. NBRC 102530]
MAETITDAHVSAVLRVFVRGCEPIVEKLREGDRKERGVDWWINHVGRLTAAVAALPRVMSVAGDKLPLADLLGSAGQGLLLCAIAAENDVDDLGTKVRLLASVLFGRDVDPAIAAGGDAGTDERTAGRWALVEENEVAPLRQALGAADEKAAAGLALVEQDEEVAAVPAPVDQGGRSTGRWALPGKDWKAVAKRALTELPVSGGKAAVTAHLLRQQGHLLAAVTEELGHRPQGGAIHQALGRLPVIGVPAGYLGERAALRQCADDAAQWLATAG